MSVLAVYGFPPFGRSLPGGQPSAASPVDYISEFRGNGCAGGCRLRLGRPSVAPPLASNHVEPRIYAGRGARPGRDRAHRSHRGFRPIGGRAVHRAHGAKPGWRPSGGNARPAGNSIDGAQYSSHGAASTSVSTRSARRKVADSRCSVRSLPLNNGSRASPIWVCALVR